MTKDAASKTKPKGDFDKAALFEDIRAHEVVDVPPYGEFVVQPLTRKQAMALGGFDGAAEIEVALISQGCVDPKLSMAEVRRWQAVAEGMALEPLSNAIARLSGLNEEAEREAVQRFPEGAGN